MYIQLKMGFISHLVRHRITGWFRLERTSGGLSSTTCSKPAPGHVAEGFIQSSLEKHRGLELHSVSEQPLSLFDPSLCELFFFFYNPGWTSLLSISAGSFLSSHHEPPWRAWVCLLNNLLVGEKGIRSPWSQVNIAPWSVFSWCIPWLGFMYSKSFIFHCFPTECNISLSGSYYQYSSHTLLSWFPSLFKMEINTMIILLNRLLVEWISDLGQ